MLDLVLQLLDVVDVPVLIVQDLLEDFAGCKVRHLSGEDDRLVPSVADVAMELGISQHTVRDHIKHVFRKTGANSRSELVTMLNHAALATTLSPRA